eukprot:26833-Rhodomonas_salina.1
MTHTKKTEEGKQRIMRLGMKGKAEGALILSRKGLGWGPLPSKSDRVFKSSTQQVPWYPGQGTRVPGCNGTVNRAILTPGPKPLLDMQALAPRNRQCSAPGPRTTPGYVLRLKIPYCS